MKGLSLTDIRKAFKVYGFDVRDESESMKTDEEVGENEEQKSILESRQNVIDFAVNHVELSSVHP